MSYQRRGATLVELLVSLAITGVAASIAVPRASAFTDRTSVRGAALDVAAALGAARATAGGRDIYASFVADSRAGRVRVVSAGELLFERDLGRVRGVTLVASRESVTFAPGGLGWGAANTTVVVSRGSRSDTVTVSRLGRIRVAW